jgi:hypothetical protein
MSSRASTMGLQQLLCDVVKFSFAGEPCQPPVVTRSILDKLFAPDHALCYINLKRKSVLHLQAWPSWLCKGYKNHIMVFN